MNAHSFSERENGGAVLHISTVVPKVVIAWSLEKEIPLVNLINLLQPVRNTTASR